MTPKTGPEPPLTWGEWVALMIVIALISCTLWWISLGCPNPADP